MRTLEILLLMCVKSEKIVETHSKQLAPKVLKSKTDIDDARMSGCDILCENRPEPRPSAMSLQKNGHVRNTKLMFNQSVINEF
jgi:hypothetical protein